MPQDDDALAYALCACRADIVLAQDLENGRASHAHRHGRVAVADRERGKDHLGKVRDGIVRDRREDKRRRPSEERDGREHHEQPDPEARHREAADREEPDRVVGPGILPDRREDPERYRDRDREKGRDDGELER